MPLKALFGFARLPDRPADNENSPDHLWQEGLPIALAVSAAVMVLTSVAVIIGLASP